jgi:hypothetical protein
MARKQTVVNRSQAQKAVKLPKGDTTKVKVATTGPRKYKTVLTPDKAAANKAAGRNSNIGKKITYSSGTTVDYTQVKPAKAAGNTKKKK